jgi:hypothetical protein
VVPDISKKKEIDIGMKNMNCSGPWKNWHYRYTNMQQLIPGPNMSQPAHQQNPRHEWRRYGGMNAVRRLLHLFRKVAILPEIPPNEATGLRMVDVLRVQMEIAERKTVWLAKKDQLITETARGLTGC